MKIPWTKTLVLLFFLTGLVLPAKAGGIGSDEEIKDRLSCLDLPVALHYNAAIRENIRRYVSSGYRDSEKMLGRTPLYFPIFEHELKRMGLPEGLKYLAIIESSLKADVRSHVGAAGLWQLMSGTARELGLRVDGSIDERLDPYKSTRAALKYLERLYNRYGSWELAIAAYNSGPGTINRAIRLGGSKDFWKIRQYLPSETRNYVPRFIAAAYLTEYYKEYDIQPDYPDYELQFTRTALVYDYISFKKLSKITRVPISTLRKLNPAYIAGYIPRNEAGNFLVLPEMGMMAFSDYLQWSDRELRTNLPVHQTAEIARDDAQKRVKVIVIVEVGNTLEDLAKAYDCTVEEIKTWNKLNSDELYVKQELVLFIPQQMHQVKPARA